MDEKQLKLSNQLCFKLYSASRAMTRLYTPILEKIGLTYPQYLAMLVLWEKEIVSFKEMSNELKLKTGTLTPILKKLEEHHYLVKRTDEKDERKIYIELTKVGMDLKEKATAIPFEIGAKAKITKKEYEFFMENLEQLLQKLYAAENEK